VKQRYQSRGSSDGHKPTYEELEQRIRELKTEVVKRKRGEKELVKHEEQ